MCYSTDGHENGKQLRGAGKGEGEGDTRIERGEERGILNGLDWLVGLSACQSVGGKMYKSTDSSDQMDCPCACGERKGGIASFQEAPCFKDYWGK